MAEIGQHHREYMLACGLASSQPTLYGDPEKQLSVFVWRITEGGLLNWSIWTEPLPIIPQSIQPITQPSEKIAYLRELYGWKSNQPVYGIETPQLRLFTHEDAWFVDDMESNLPYGRMFSFVWRFDFFEQAVDSMLRYFAEGEFATKVKVGHWHKFWG